MTLETERLQLRHFREEDLDAYAEICADPVVMRYLGEGKILSRAEAWRQMAMFAGHWHLRGYGIWAVDERGTGRLMGRIGLHNPEGWPGLELGWVLARSAWGNGYATEGAQRALEYTFNDLQQDQIISLIHPENSASIRVAERLGETLKRRIELFGHSCLVYGIDRKSWLTRRTPVIGRPQGD
ncbi:MAG TPA: GNAT family N-acetyltransferase [Blastocatellia bacterium]